MYSLTGVFLQTNARGGPGVGKDPLCLTTVTPSLKRQLFPPQWPCPRLTQWTLDQALDPAHHSHSSATDSPKDSMLDHLPRAVPIRMLGGGEELQGSWEQQERSRRLSPWNPPDSWPHCPLLSLGPLPFLSPLPSALFSVFLHTTYPDPPFFHSPKYLRISTLGGSQASLIAQLAKNPPAMQEILVWVLGWEDPLEKGKEGYPLQYAGLENSMDCIVHGVAKSQTRLSYFHSLT